MICLILATNIYKYHQLITEGTKMLTKAVFPGKYIQGKDAQNELPALVNLFGSRGLIIASKTVKDDIIPKLTPQLMSNSLSIELFRGECCEEELKRIDDIIKRDKIDVLIGMGGGKTIDTAKIAADRANIAVIIVPTIASSDAPCSGCAVTYTSDGIFEAVHYQKMNPQVVLVDMNIMADAPTRLLVAGMGDALATWFEATSCKQSNSMNECGGLSTIAGLSIAKLCYKTILKYGIQAKLANEQKIITPALENVVEANILLSGIGFESSGLAAAHSIHNGLTALKETHNFFHGEKVAYGVLAGLHLIETNYNDINIVYSFCENIGLPTTLADIGLGKVTKEELLLVAEKSCLPGASIYHEVSEITPEKVLKSLIRADSFGKKRKSKMA